MPTLGTNRFEGWTPDADEVNAPPGSLLRADNLVLDEQGALAVRSGSTKVDTSLTGGSVLTLGSFYIGDTLHRFAQVGSKLYRNGSDTGITFDGTGDIAIGTDAYQVFVARGTTRKKFDGTTWRNWAIAAPSGAPTLSAGNAVTTTVAGFGPTTTGTASGALTDTDAVAGTTTTFTLTAAGTGSILAGDNVTFGNDTSNGIYRVTSGDADISDGGSITISPAIATSWTTNSCTITIVKESNFPTASSSSTFTVTDGSSSSIAGPGAFGGATQFTTTASGRISAYKTFSADTDFHIVQGVDGGDTDIFDMYVAVSDWDKVETVTAMFGLNTGTDPFLTDRYSFDWDFRPGAQSKVSDPAAQVSSAMLTSALDVARTVDPAEILKFKEHGEIVRIKNQLGNFGDFRTTIRRDTAQSSPAWFHLSVSRGQFQRTGATAGRGWQTVRGFKIAVKTAAGTYTASFATAVWYGGGSRALTGTYRALLVAVRETDNYTELSPVSPVSAEKVLNQNSLTVTIPASVISGLDSQVTGLWVYLFSNTLGGWYRFAVSGLQSFGMSMDEFDPTPDGSIDTDDLYRFSQWGLVVPGGAGQGSAAVSCLIGQSEIDALRAGVKLVPYLAPPPENIVATAGPYLNRMFVLTEEGWLYVSAADSPSHFNGLHTQDLRRYGDALWIAKTTGGIFVGMSHDVIHIGGTGDEDGVGNVDLFPEPLGLGNPPVDAAFYTDGNTIVYRAADGLMTLTGVTNEPVTKQATSLLWRGHTRHGVSPLNITTGRFRLAVDNHVLYMIAPEGSTTSGSTAIWRYDTTRQKWYRTVYTASFTSLHRDPDGNMLAGDTSGNVWYLEDGSTTDGGSPIPITLWFPADDGQQPYRRKTAHDLNLEVFTGGQTLTANVYLDGFDDTTAATWTASTADYYTHHQSVYGLSDFSRIQLRLTGSFSNFRLRSVGLSYRLHPQQRMSVDSGYLQPPNNGDLAWIQEVELSVRSPVDLEVVPIFDDVVQDTLSVDVTPNVYSTYRVPLKRGQNKGRKPRILVRTTNAAAEGNPGFELEWMRVRYRGTGNQTEVPLVIAPEAV